MATSRLKHTLNSAGVSDRHAQGSGSQSSQSSHLTATAESVLTKQAAEADAVTRKVDNAVRQMPRLQEGLERRRLALEASGTHFPQDFGKGRSQQRLQDHKKRKLNAKADGKGHGHKKQGKWSKGKGKW